MAEQQLVKPFIKLSDEEYEAEMAKRRDPAESKIYVILIYAPEEDEINYKWFPCVGRTEVYETLKTLIQSYAIDLRKSRILVSGTTYEDSSSVYAVMRHFANIYNDGFDVDTYDRYPEDVEEDTRPLPPIKDMFTAPNYKEMIDKHANEVGVIFNEEDGTDI